VSDKVLRSSFETELVVNILHRDSVDIEALMRRWVVLFPVLDEQEEVSSPSLLKQAH
jgi:hypothetical protein